VKRKWYVAGNAAKMSKNIWCLLAYEIETGVL